MWAGVCSKSSGKGLTISTGTRDVLPAIRTPVKHCDHEICVLEDWEVVEVVEVEVVVEVVGDIEMGGT